VAQGLAVSLQVLVDGVALVVGLQGLQLVQEGQVLFRVLRSTNKREYNIFIRIRIRNSFIALVFAYKECGFVHNIGH